jgi:hypothetical protein
MSTSIEQILDSFEHLPEADKHTVAFEIIRRTVNFDPPALTDEELVMNAGALFLELDGRELGDEQS